MSKKTKEYKRKYRFCQFASFSLLVLPVAIFSVIGFSQGTPTEKTSLAVGVTLAMIFAAANAAFKLAPRSAIWILIMSMTIAIQKIQNVIIVTGTCVIIEECVTSKLETYYKDKFKINREIDDRMGGIEDGAREKSDNTET